MKKGRIGIKPDVSPQWRARREGYARLGDKYRMRRLRDRADMSGLPNVRSYRGKYSKATKFPKSNVAQRFAERIRADMPKFKTTGFSMQAPYIAQRFAAELESSTIASISEEMDKALAIIRSRAEKQLGEGVEVTRAEQDYLRALKAHVIRQVQNSAVKWRAELVESLPKVKPEEVWHHLVDKEFEVKNDATAAARSLLGDVYNSYMAWLVGRKAAGGLFKWVNPMDKRTSDICRKIVARTRGGVSMTEMKLIVSQEADKSWFKTLSPLLPHPLCRSTFVLIKRH